MIVWKIYLIGVLACEWRLDFFDPCFAQPFPVGWKISPMCSFLMGNLQRGRRPSMETCAPKAPSSQKQYWVFVVSSFRVWASLFLYWEMTCRRTVWKFVGCLGAQVPTVYLLADLAQFRWLLRLRFLFERLCFWGCCLHCLRRVTWLILPVVICLSQRLSHACLSTILLREKLRKAH